MTLRAPTSAAARDAATTGTDTPRAAGADIADATPAGPVFDNTAKLSEREVDIVRRIATGMSNDQIADSIFVSVNTVKSYIRSAYRKMRVGTRSHAVVWAFDHGLVSPVLTKAALAAQRTPTTADVAARAAHHHDLAS